MYLAGPLLPVPDIARRGASDNKICRGRRFAMTSRVFIVPRLAPGKTDSAQRASITRLKMKTAFKSNRQRNGICQIRNEVFSCLQKVKCHVFYILDRIIDGAVRTFYNF